MLLTLALALAHPDHGSPRSQTLDAAVFRDRFPPVPVSYDGVVTELKARLVSLRAATQTWKVADVVHECDTMVRFTRALPVKVVDLPETTRHEVNAARTDLLHHISVLRSGIPTHDGPLMLEALTAIEAALDALPAVSKTP